MKFIFRFILYSFLITTLSCCSRSQSKDIDDVVIGGFRFGAAKEEILQVAKSLNYDIVPFGDYNFYLKGNINALGITWEEMRVMFDSVNGIKQIHLLRPLDSVSEDMIDKHYEALHDIFPNTKKLPFSLGVSAGDSFLKNNYANIIDINDSRPKGYSGSTYFIVDGNSFNFLICSKFTK